MIGGRRPISKFINRIKHRSSALIIYGTKFFSLCCSRHSLSVKDRALKSLSMLDFQTFQIGNQNQSVSSHGPERQGGLDQLMHGHLCKGNQDEMSLVYLLSVTSLGFSVLGHSLAYICMTHLRGGVGGWQ